MAPVDLPRAAPVGHHSLGSAIAHLRSRWPWFAALGAAFILLGAIAFGSLITATIASVLVNGAGLCVAGLVRIYVASQMGQEAPWRIAILSGLVTFFLGVIILAGWPTNSWYVLGLFLAIDLIFYGVALLGLAFQLRAHHIPA